MTDMSEIDVVKVRLVNPEEIAIRTEEHVPEHFITATYVVQFNSTSGINTFEQVLAQDPLRESATITSPDQAIILCHSRAQVNDPANQVAGVPFPQGMIVPAGATVSVDGTGRLWAVATTAASPARIGVCQNRRGDA